MGRRREWARWMVWSALSTAGCVHRPRPSAQLFPEPVTIMGHRGAAALAPENTLASFQVAAELGVPFELDTAFCGTGELVVIHDDTLERTTNGAGAVSATPLSTLQGLDAGSHFDPRFSAEAVPTLAEVLETFAPQVVVNIEIKAGKGADATALATAVARLVTDKGMTERVIITSFNPFVLEQVRLTNPAILRGQIYGTFRGSDLNAVERLLLRKLAFNRRAQPDLLMMEDALATRPYVRRMKRRGYRVFVWTVNTPDAAAELISVGVDGIITNRPDLLLPLTAR